jgi:hypothetical protein
MSRDVFYMREKFDINIIYDIKMIELLTAFYM